MIHSTAIVHKAAQLDSSVEIGPYAIIDEGVVLGAGCKIGPYVYITGKTTIGEHNQFFAGCVIGEAPQDLKYQGESTTLDIGANNVFREHVTVHRSAKRGESTVIGSQNFLMANCHVGHNSLVGNRVIMANGAMLGGHVTVADRVFISGNCLVHQFVRVGTLALMQGGAAISKDLPPYTVARRGNKLCGLNVVGLRRAGLTAEERLELKGLYHALFLSGTNLSAALAEAEGKYSSAPAKTLLDFVMGSKRGVVMEDADSKEIEESTEAGD